MANDREEMRLRLYACAEHIAVLGPGDRFVVWVQGCARRCVGCIAEDAQSFEGGEVAETDALAERIVGSGADGVTFSGGEPMLQAAALLRLIRRVREKKDAGLIVYTGERYEKLLGEGTRAQRELLAETDVLIDGEYEIAKDDGKPHRGSSNQRILFLTARYEREREGYYGGGGARQTQTQLLSADCMLTVGIPDVLPRGGALGGREVFGSKRIKY